MVLSMYISPKNKDKQTHWERQADAVKKQNKVRAKGEAPGQGGEVEEESTKGI